MKAIYWYHEMCVPVTGTVTSDSPMHGICAGCGQEGQVVRVEIKTGPVPEIGEARKAREEAESIPSSEKWPEPEGEVIEMPTPSEVEIALHQTIEEPMVEVASVERGAVVMVENVTDTLEAQLEALSKQIEELKAARKEAGEE